MPEWGQTQQQTLYSTIKPAGLTVTRAGMKFTVTWKVMDENYDGGIEVQYRTWEGGRKKADQDWTAWKSVTVYRGDTSASKSFSASSYYPVLQVSDDYPDGKEVFLFGVVFQVRGKRKAEDGKTYDWSAWAEKTMDLSAPGAPSVSQELDSELENKTTFSWNANASDTNTKPAKDVEWQSILVQNCNVTDGSKLDWAAPAPDSNSTTIDFQTGTGGLESSKAITDESELVLTGYYTRWFRVRTRGCGGNNGLGVSAWKYSKHVYSIPTVPTITSAAQTGFIWYEVEWTASTNAYRPIDYVEVQWCIGYPDINTGLTPTPSWNTAATLTDSTGIDKVAFTINQALELDECLWVQVVAWHDRRHRESRPFLVKTAKMTRPEDLAVETSGNRVTVSAAYNGNVPEGTTLEPNVKIAVICRKTNNTSSGASSQEPDPVIGLIYYGQEETFVYPAPAANETVRFGVYSFVGSWTSQTDTDTSVTTYTINPTMQSDNQWAGGYVPRVPTNVSAVTTETPGEVLLTWKWPNWANVNRAEVSWSKNPNAWESNKGPETYTMTSLNQARIRISELEIGATWYFRIRLANETERTTTYGPYSDTVQVILSSSPSIPVLTLSRGVIPVEGSYKASWVYASTDGTKQAYAEIVRAYLDDDGEVDHYGSATVATATSAKSVNITAKKTWTPGQYNLVVHVQSESGLWSEYSDPVALYIVEPIECEITDTSLVSRTITDELNNSITVYDLTELPLSVAATGATAGGTTQVIIERADEYHIRRPDETALDGYDGETVAIARVSGEKTVYIAAEDLVGRLDDGAPYRLIVSATDSYGQTDTKTIDFEVHWTHQAEKPTATVDMENGAAVITVTAPTGYVAGDVCDIYRLTADNPELIVGGGEFGIAYVDPYPAIGRGFGHRCVHRTLNGDYITEDMQPAWIDLSDMDGDIFESDHGIINFDGYELHFRYNNELSSTWDKDFQQTRYLGGSIVGDWNPGVVRQTTINAILLADVDEDFRNLRRLADYTGICHVRTPEGSSFSADVQVGDSISYSEAGRLVHATLTCTRVDAVEPDGVTYEEWTS